MPANLPPEYYEEERRLRQARSLDEKIEIIERMLAIIPHHKGTDKLIGALRAKISKLKEERDRRPKAQRKLDQLYNVKKEGAGQVLLIGFPNSGKSSIVSALSGEYVEVADYPFTTKALEPRMMRYEDIWIQLVDTVALEDESTSIWFGNMVKRADLIACVLGLSETVDLEFELVLEELKRYLKDTEIIKASTIVVLNKVDLLEYATHLSSFQGRYGAEFEIVPVSAKEEMNIDYLRTAIFKRLRIIRVYSKVPGKKPDLDTPFVLKKGSTVMDFAERIHNEFPKRLKYAKLWRQRTLNGMMVSREFVLEDKDIVELHV
jgi:small GTP-binding protein